MADEQPELEALADGLLLRRAELIDAQVQALSQFPHYREVSDEELRVSCDRNVIRAASILRGRDHLPPEIVEDERRSGVKRAQQGIPAEVVLAAYRRVIGVIRDAYLSEATERGIRLEATLLGMRRLWELTDHFSSALVSSRHEVDLDLARRNEQHRIDFVRGALDGTNSPSQSYSSLDYGVLAGGRYWILRARHRRHDRSFVQTIERVGRTSTFSPLVIMMGQDVAGIVGARPDGPELDHGLVAIAGPVQPSEFAAAFDEASRVLDAAWRFGMTGSIDMGGLGLLVPIAEQVDIGEFCYGKYISPVLNGSAMGQDIVDSVRVFLDTARSVRDTSVRLSIHVNTLRYRLEKFEEITGCSLQSTDTLVEVWWALKFASITV